MDLLAIARPFLELRYARDAELARGEINCSLLVEAVLRGAFPTAPWSGGVHRDLMILDPARPWSPLDAVELLRIGHRVDAPVAGRWHVAQGWRGLRNGHVVDGSRGHAFLWCAGESGSGHVLEATSAPVRWSRDATWSQQLAKFDEVRLAVLQEIA